MYLRWYAGINIACMVFAQGLYAGEMAYVGTKRKHIDNLSTSLQNTLITHPVISHLQQLPTVLLDYVATFNTHHLMKAGELKAWRTYGLINKQCNSVAKPLIQKSLDAHLASTGEYAVFKQLMHIFKITSKLTRNPLPSDEQLRSLLLPPHNQTQGGLFLICDSFTYEIHSPWGKLRLIGPDSSTSYMIHTFLSRISTTLHDVRLPCYRSSDRPHYYLTDIATWHSEDNIYNPTKLIRLSEATLSQHKGKNVLIMSLLEGYYSTLMVNAVDNEPVPPASYRKYSKYRSMGLTKKLWGQFLAQYKQSGNRLKPTIKNASD